MRIEIHPELTDDEKLFVFRLWNAEYPAGLSFLDVAGLDEFIAGVSERSHYLIFDEHDAPRGWLMTFTRDGERWFSIIIDSTGQKRGLGTAVLNEVMKRESNINGWVVEANDHLKNNGEVYVSPLAFYEKTGFTILRDIRNQKQNCAFIKINWTRKHSE